jgi:hypothetical protein
VSIYLHVMPKLGVSGTRPILLLLYTFMARVGTNHHFKADTFRMVIVSSVMIIAREYHIMITTEPDSLRKFLKRK